MTKEELPLKSDQPRQKAAQKKLRSITLQVEVDLQNREIIFKENIKRKLNLEFNTTNVDQLIKEHIDPKDLDQVKQSLLKAEAGLEDPIRFCFVHPLTAEKLCMEYKYEIVYVKYAQTRLHGTISHSQQRQKEK